VRVYSIANHWYCQKSRLDGLTVENWTLSTGVHASTKVKQQALAEEDKAEEEED